METRESIILAELLAVNKESSAQIALLVEEVKYLRKMLESTSNASNTEHDGRL